MNEVRYYTRNEVVIHNKTDDIWVIINNVIFNLTCLIENRSDTMNDSLRLLIQLAGKDLSHYFDKTDEPLMRLNQYGNTVPVFPPAFEKEHDVNLDYWWKDSRYKIGKITCMNRKVRMINTLTRKTIYMTVCEEDTIEDIQRKYYKYNDHYDGYTWRKTHTQDHKSGHLFMDKTLTENGLLYEKNEQYGLPPAFWLYFINSP